MILESTSRNVEGKKKMKRPEVKLEVNDVVWILAEWIRLGMWPLARVTRKFIDKTARSCEVKMPEGLLTQPIVELAHEPTPKVRYAPMM